jgi:hypothetical protein
MLYLVAKPCHVGADMDGIAYSLQHPTVCSRQGFLTGATPSYPIVVGSAACLGGCEAFGPGYFMWC